MRCAVLAAAAALGLGGASPQAGIYAPPTADLQPVVAHDSSAIVFFRTPGFDRETAPPGLYVTHPDGSGTRPLAGVPPSQTFALSRLWHWLAVVTFPNGKPSLVVMRPDGSEARIVATAENVNDSFTTLTWAPDEQRLAYDSRGGIFVVGLDGGAPRFLTGGARPSWSPDGSHIAFTTDRSVAVVRPDGSARQAWQSALPPEPVWSPDGARVAFVSSRPSKGSATITVGSVGFGDRAYAAHHGAFAIAWAPSGKSFVYAATGALVNGRFVDSGLWQVELGKYALAAQTRLTAWYPSAMQWAPNGAWLAASAGGACRDRLGIYRVDLAGPTQPKRLTNDCHIRGTDGPDDLHGSSGYDILVGLGGDDRLATNDGNYQGDDAYGGAGNDVVTGGWWPNILDGGPGDDIIAGGPSRDTITGGPGRDVLNGEGGSDRIHARDGERDVVDCGWNNASTGPDTAWVDTRDVVHHCPRVLRG